MAIIYVFNTKNNTIERYYRGILEPMPYVRNRTMTVGEFRAESRSNILWTTREMMEAWNIFRENWRRPIFVGYAFKRIWEGGHSGQSQHYAGVALDMGHTMTETERDAFRNYAIRSNLWSYVEPKSLTPRWVHVDKRYGDPACAEGGYPLLTYGDKGVYVFVLQDALSALGYPGGGLDGIFGPRTQRALSEFQRVQGLTVNGTADCATWLRLTSLANGIGQTPTVIL